MHKPLEPLQHSILALSIASIVAVSSPAKAARRLQEDVAPEVPSEAGAIDVENFGLTPEWLNAIRIEPVNAAPSRTYAIFRLAQVAEEQRRQQAEAPVESPDVAPAPVEKPGFRTRPPAAREPTPPPAPSSPAVAEERRTERPVPPRSFRRARLDIRERDPMERPSLLKPFAGRWLDGEFLPIQIPGSTPSPIPPPTLPSTEPTSLQPQVVPPPAPTPGPEIPTAPATTEFPKPELFPSGDSPNAPFPMPWETSAGNGVAPRTMQRTEPEPAEESPPPPNELPLRQMTNAWDLAEIEGPLFGTEQIAEFTREINAKGKWSVRPHFTTTALWDGNVFLDERDQTSDYIVTAFPGVTARIGNEQTPLYLTADYTLGAIVFLDNTDESSLNHNARLSLDWRGARTTVSLRLGFENDSGTSIDASDRVRRTAFSAGLQSHFQYSDKFSVDLNGDFRRSYFEDLIGGQDYGVQFWANYHYSPKVVLGMGVGYVSSKVETGRSQTAQTASLRAQWIATGKLTLEASGGIGFYQFSDDEPDVIAPLASLRATYVATQKLTFAGDVGVGVVRYDAGGTTLTPTFGVDATWAVRDGTALSFNAYSRVFNSAVFIDQNFVTTGTSVSLRQSLGIRFLAFVTAGYENLNYVSAGEGVDATRQDNFFFARFGLQWQAFERCSFGVFYEFSNNSSSGEEQRDFRRDRTGLQMSVIF